MKRLLIGAALASMLIELSMIPTMLGPGDFWPAAAIFAVLFGVGAWWASRSDAWGPRVLLTLLFAVEVLGLPGYSRTRPVDWLTQGAIGIASLVGLVAVVGVSMAARRARNTATA